MLIDPIWKFFEEKNDPGKNDQLEKVFIQWSFSSIKFFFPYRFQMR
jgi:hypothetical protein